jgi:autophagy-related protein 9
VKRRQGSISGGSTGVAAPGMASVYHSSTAIATAQTAILGDSQGSLPPPAASISGQESVAAPDDLMPDAVAASELGDSYVDGNLKAGPIGAQGMDSEEREGIEDDGVLKLLAQIYGVNRPQALAGII